jgi:hypothetical protein
MHCFLEVQNPLSAPSFACDNDNASEPKLGDGLISRKEIDDGRRTPHMSEFSG